MKQWLVFGIIVLAWLFIFAMLLPHAAWPEMIDQAQFSLSNLPVGGAHPCRKTKWRHISRPHNRLRTSAISLLPYGGWQTAMLRCTWTVATT
jgi:hypothetical protein